MNTYPFKKIASLLFLSVLLFAFRPVQILQTDFSGTWKLNENKSELGQFGARGVPSKIVIEQKADGISLTKTATSFQGEESTGTELLSFDGKESESLFLGTSKKKSALKWLADGKEMVISSNIAFEMQGQTIDISSVENWSLSADGKTISVSSKINTPQGEIATKSVFDKQ
jgi:hypothetical protein